MKITDVELITLAGPPLPEVAHPAWAPGSTWTRWGGTIVRISTDEGITGIGTPGYAATSNFESWVKPQLIGYNPAYG